ncbi:hypothetical protein A2767_07725 [Candidatus Roizmanbacteria bacterium RIFCSPHIGHO2_01_FULL_35_10]|uniref:Uncharacterized protein n=1 Tax=Candidatus Roizmanbacteria bacterium RIFCSPLOWO2_01_FULL_35_13 TaxID=1802055 RepID=A0A1F7ICS0_9BACT|nr:MAG: hypothetical protein A2767_07725 [Candidatus Roizmanbacteria bacterium RIFCSPHIGHO2_01_FULL_35_10]OGK41155.1 MAG: hypothetical protein A3A74_02320 [Candidatus Roizmanbacteria bacterium RIFCSPLOWO2_01_FULL_35_13]
MDSGEFTFIRAGIFAKKIIDHLGFAAVNSSPFVEHRNTAHVFKNLQKEESRIEVNENLHKKVVKVRLKSRDPGSCHKELAGNVEFPPGEYFKILKKAITLWANCY